MKKFLQLLAGFTTFLTFNQIALAAFSGDITINRQDITFSTDNFTEGKKIRIYATAGNNSNNDLLGIVRFYDNGQQISGDQVISLFANKTDGVFIDWIAPYGSREISVRIFPWQPEIDNPANNIISTDVFVIQDTDHDGTPNVNDDDDDNDGIPDTEDAFPLDPKEQKDTDGDGKGDNTDDDDDNDGVPDKADDMPLDPNETIDSDHDGIGNIADPDDDNDGIPDTEEDRIGTNATNPDTDQDKTPDKQDAFPLNPDEQLDTDKDKIGNNADTDDENDGIPDTQDPFPLNKAPVIKLQDETLTLDLLNEETFDASPSHDDDGDIVSYKWEIDGKLVREGNSINHIFRELGTHTIKLTVTDDSGESISREFQVSVFNIGLYKQLGIILVAILLALVIYFKYISRAPSSELNNEADKSHKPED